MAGNSNLHASARNKQDEFYTQLSMIENELKHYAEHFKDKVVFCNCDGVQKSVTSEAVFEGIQIPQIFPDPFFHFDFADFDKHRISLIIRRLLLSFRSF